MEIELKVKTIGKIFVCEHSFSYSNLRAIHNCARCDWSVRVHYSSIKHAANVTRVLYRVLYHNKINARALIGQLNPWKFRVSSELSYKSNRPQVFYGL